MSDSYHGVGWARSVEGLGRAVLIAGVACAAGALGACGSGGSARLAASPDSPLLGGSRGGSFGDAVRLDVPRTATIMLTSATPRTAPDLLRTLGRDLRDALRRLPPASHGPEDKSPASLDVGPSGAMRLAYVYGDNTYRTDIAAVFVQHAVDGTFAEVQLSWDMLYGAPRVHLGASGEDVLSAMDAALERALAELPVRDNASGVKYAR